MIKDLRREVERLREVITSTHKTYCTAAWTDRELHAPECLMYEIEGSPAGAADGPAQPPPDGIPRRIRIDRQCPAEGAIRAAIAAVESMPADTRLTEAVNLLDRARERVADFVDGVVDKTPEPPSAPPEPEEGVAHCSAGDHYVTGLLLNGVCIGCWRDQARIANAQSEAAHERVRELRARVAELEKGVRRVLALWGEMFPSKACPGDGDAIQTIVHARSKLTKADALQMQLRQIAMAACSALGWTWMGDGSQASDAVRALVELHRARQVCWSALCGACGCPRYTHSAVSGVCMRHHYNAGVCPKQCQRYVEAAKPDPTPDAVAEALREARRFMVEENMDSSLASLIRGVEALAKRGDRG